MNKIFLISALILGGLAQPTIAQPTQLSSVIQKFKSDSQSFEEFVILGKMYCYKMNIYKTSDIYFNAYASLYNALKPFTRLIKKDAIDQSIQAYMEEVPSLNKASSLYEQMKRCDDWFQKDKLQISYMNLVSNPDHYLVATDDYDSFSSEEIDGFRLDYLNGYLIQIEAK